MTQCIQMIDVFQEGALECCVLAVFSLQRRGTVPRTPMVRVIRNRMTIGDFK
jgi:hypothetical protein